MATTRESPRAAERPKTRDEAISQAIDSVLRDKGVAEEVRVVGRVIDSLSIEGQPSDLGRRVNVKLCDMMAGKNAGEIMQQLGELETGTSENGRIEDAVAARLETTADSDTVGHVFKKYFDEVNSRLTAGEPAAPKVAEATPGKAAQLGEEDLEALPGAKAAPRYDGSPEAKADMERRKKAAEKGKGLDLEEPGKPKAAKPVTEAPGAVDRRKLATELNNSGVKLYNQGKYAESQQRFQKSRTAEESTVNTSNDAHAKYQLGQDNDQVMKDLRHALELNGNNAHAWNLMGVSAAKQGADASALVLYQKAVDAIESGKWQASDADRAVITANRDRCKARLGKTGKGPTPAEGEGGSARQGQDMVGAVDESGAPPEKATEAPEEGRKPKVPLPIEVREPWEEETPKFAGGGDRFIDRVAGKMTVNEVDAMLVFIGQDPTLGEVKYSIHEKKELLRKAYQDFCKLTPKEVHPRDRIGLWRELLHGKLDSQNITQDSPIAKPAIYGEYVRRETAITEAGDFVVKRLLREAEYFTEKVSRAGGSLHDACHRQPMVTTTGGLSLVGAAAGALFLI